MKRKSIKIIALTVLVAVVAIARPADAAEQAPAQVTDTVISLDRAYRLAIKNNPDLSNLDESIRQAEITIYKAWSLLLPNLSANGTVTRNDQELAQEYPDFTALLDPNYAGGDPGTIKMVVQEKQNQQYGFTANMTLFNASAIPLIINSYDNVDRARYAATHSRGDLLFAVAAAYSQIESAKMMELAAQENLENAEQFERLATARKRVEQATRIDVLRAQNLLLRAKRDLKNASDAVRLAKSALSALCGIAENFDVTSARIPGRPSGSVEQLTRHALDGRTDLKAGLVGVEMARRNKISTALEWVPTIDLTYNWRHDSLENFNGENESWRAVLSARWSIFQGGMRFARLAEDASNLRVAENTARKLKLEIRRQTEQSAIEVDKARRNVELAREELDLADESYRLLSRQYEVGMADSLDVQEASARLAAARANLVVEQLRRDVAILNLNKTVGNYDKLGPQS